VKKYLCILLLALLFSLGTLAGGHLWVNGARDRMDIRETVITGDPAAAAGLAVTYRTRDQEGRLLWETTYTPGGAERAETDFRFSAEGEQRSYYGRDIVSLEQASGNFSAGGVSIPGQEDERNYQRNYYSDLLLLPAWDVASRTPVGEERTETIRLADYYDYYPLSFNIQSVDNPGLNAHLNSDEYVQLKEYFRVAVDEAALRTVTVIRDSESMSVEMTRADDDPSHESGYLSSEGVITEDGIFLVAESTDSSGVPDNRLQCPDGQGIHFIPLQDPDAPQDPTMPEGLDLSGLRLFYPTGEARTLRLSISPDKKELLLYAQEDGKLTLSVIDAVTGELLQCLDLLEDAGTQYIQLIETDALHLAITEEDRFSLVSKEGGRYGQVLSGQLGMIEEEERAVQLGRGRQMLAWDGRRMALAFAWQDAFYYGGSGTGDIYNNSVGVWDRNGLQFLGGYSFALSRDTGSSCYSGSPDPLSLTFTGE
jgi:hypothetical protein